MEIAPLSCGWVHIRDVVLMSEQDQFDPSKYNPDIKRLGYADLLNTNNNPKNSIVSEYEDNRFAVIFAMHDQLISKEYLDVNGDFGKPGEILKSRGLPYCMGAINRIWDTRPSVDGIGRNQIVTICKPGNIVVPSGAAIPGLATAPEMNKPSVLERIGGFLRGTGTQRKE